MGFAVFYEVQDRLYNAALAGSGILSEDFRLKRAVEGLTTLAEKGKVFAAFQQKCEKLFAAGEDATLLLSDCIALADAIAVTLGRTGSDSPTSIGRDENENAESADTAPEEKEGKRTQEAENVNTDDGIWRDRCPVKDIPASVLAQAYECLDKGSEKVLEIPDLFPDVLTDIRFCTRLADALNGKASYHVDLLASIVLEIGGMDFAKILKKGVHLSDEAAKGRQVSLIAQKYGAVENAWYLELAQNEKSPQKVRIEAIAALALCKDNEAVLTELYQTGKGKIKNAAIESLVRINAESIQSYLEKLCEKEKRTEAEEGLIETSASVICEKYALDRVKWGIANPNEQGAINYLDHKTGEMAEEAHLLLGRYALKNYGKNIGPQCTLVYNLIEEYEGTAALLDRLYAKDPILFEEAHLYDKFLKGTAEAIDFKKVHYGLVSTYREDERCPAAYKTASEMARCIRALPGLGKYRLEWDTYGVGINAKVLGEHFPEVLLQVLTSADALKDFHATAECCMTLTRLCLKCKGEKGGSLTGYDNGIYGVGDWDRGLIEQYAYPFLEKAVEKHPAVYYGAYIHRLLPDRKGKTDLYYEFVLKNAELSNADKDAKPGVGWNLSYYVEDSDKAQMLKEYEFAKKKLNSWMLTMSKDEKQRIMSVIDRALGNQ